MFDEFYVEQTLHGYSNGHRLLQASCKLSEQDSKKMMTLSDLSGNEFVGGFERYFTGYSLSNGYIVLACTWYAEEMKRPGCVWTHSLIINPQDLMSNRMIVSSIINLFSRPVIDVDLEIYNQPLKVKCCDEVRLDADNLKYLIWCLWGNKCPLVIFDNSSENLEKELLFLFLAQHDLLETGFSFCTGSVSLRGYDGSIMQIQIAPYKISRSKMYIGEKAFEAKEKAVIKNYPLWVNKIYDNIEKDSMNTFRKFMQGFSNEFKKTYYLSSFVKLYVGARVDTNGTNLIELLQMASVIFNDKRKICNEIIKLYSNQYFSKWCGPENYIKAIEFFAKNIWLDTSAIDLKHWIRQAYNTDFVGSKLLFKNMIVQDEENEVELYIKTYAEIVPIDKFTEFTDLEFEGCSTLISIRNEFALCEGIWKQKKGYQQRIITCLKKQEKTLNAEIIETVLNISEFDFSFELYKVYEKECLPIYWERLLLDFKTNRTKGMINIVKTDIDGGIKRILANLKNRDKLLILMSIVDSYSRAARELKKDDISTIYYTIMEKECSDKEKELLAKFLMPFCLIEDYIVGIDIAEFSFNIVNRMLAIQIFPEDEWNKLERILPEVAYYNNWDRCKRLRKGFRKKGYPFIKKRK